MWYSYGICVVFVWYVVVWYLHMANDESSGVEIPRLVFLSDEIQLKLNGDNYVDVDGGFTYLVRKTCY